MEKGGRQTQDKRIENREREKREREECRKGGREREKGREREIHMYSDICMCVRGKNGMMERDYRDRERLEGR